MKSTLAIFMGIVVALQTAQAAHKHFNGVAHVNSKAFDKIIPRFKVALVKFDLVHSMGQMQKAFKTVADWSIDDDDMIVVEVCVEYKGINNDLMERFELKKRELPMYMLFVRGRDKPLQYFGDILRADDIIDFVQTKSRLWFEHPKFMEKYDNLVEEFFDAKPKNRELLVEKAGNETVTIKDEVIKERALIYVDTMREILEHGDQYLDTVYKEAHSLVDTGAYEDFLEKDRMAARCRIMDVFVQRKKAVQLKKRAEEL
jgi:endoplasmic reticulum protein 29